MTEPSTTVFTVRSLDECHHILETCKHRTLKNTFYEILNGIWVKSINFILSLLAKILFINTSSRPSDPIKKIAVYTSGVLGDNITKLAAISYLKKIYPNASITVLICTGPDSPLPDQLFRNLSYVDQCHVINNHVLDSMVCDLFIDFSGSANTGNIRHIVREMFYAYRMKAQYAAGFYISTFGLKKRLRFVQHNFLDNESVRPFNLLRKAGFHPEITGDVLPVNVEAKESLLTKMGKIISGPIIVIAPGGSKPAKLWPAERFAAVSDILTENANANVILAGASSDMDAADKVFKSAERPVINLAGKTTVAELIELLRIADICITNDSGSMHIAGALNIPTVAVFNTHLPPTWWFPPGDRIVQLFSLCICSFCNSFSCESQECLRNISVEHVIGAVRKIFPEKKFT